MFGQRKLNCNLLDTKIGIKYNFFIIVTRLWKCYCYSENNRQIQEEKHGH